MELPDETRAKTTMSTVMLRILLDILLTFYLPFESAESGAGVLAMAAAGSNRP